SDGPRRGGGVRTTIAVLVEPSLTLSGPSSVAVGDNYQLNVQASALGSASFQSLTIDWDDGSTSSFTTFPASVSHVYSDGPNFLAVTATATYQIGSSVEAVV